MKISMEVDPKSLKEVDELDEEFRTGTLEGVRKAMFLVEGAAKKRFGTPGNLRVQSGRLRSSIKTNVNNYRDVVVGAVGSDVVYAPVHELGSRDGRVPPRPFLRPSIEENIDKINDIITDSINREVK